MLKEGGDPDRQKSIALRAASEDMLPVVWEVDVTSIAQSPTTSTTAILAAASSTMDLPAAKVATRACRARLLTARGRPLDACWRTATASSLKSGSLRPARVRWWGT